MDLAYGAEYEAFREEVKAFIREHKHRQPQPGDGLRSQALKDWQSALIEHGYHSRTVPRDYGGYGAEPDIIKSRIENCSPTSLWFIALEREEIEK